MFWRLSKFEMPAGLMDFQVNLKDLDSIASLKQLVEPVNIDKPGGPDVVEVNVPAELSAPPPSLFAGANFGRLGPLGPRNRRGAAVLGEFAATLPPIGQQKLHLYGRSP